MQSSQEPIKGDLENKFVFKVRAQNQFKFYSFKQDNDFAFMHYFICKNYFLQRCARKNIKDENNVVRIVDWICFSGMCCFYIMNMNDKENIDNSAFDVETKTAGVLNANQIIKVPFKLPAKKELSVL